MLHGEAEPALAGAHAPDAPPPAPAGGGRLLGCVLVALWFCALNFQTVTFTGAIVSENNGPVLKMYHGLFGALALLLLARHRVVRWRREMAIYFAVTLLTTAIAYMQFGARAGVVNTLFAAYAATLAATLGFMAGEEGAVRALRVTSVVVLLAVLVKAVLYFPQILAFLAAPNGHPTLPFFYGGGPNLEATWVAMAGVFFLGSRLFLPYVTASAALSLLYASRVGVIIVALVLLGAALRASAARREAGRPRRAWVAVAAVACCAAGAARVASADTGGVSYIVKRFQNIGDEPGSVGRLTLWEGGVKVFVRHPFGVGLGNSVPQGERLLGVDVPEDNLHNQYLQHLAETGVQGLAAYLLFAGITLWRLAAGRYRSRMLMYVAIYFVVATIQFRGAEALLWFVYGLQTGTSVGPEAPHAS